MSRGHTPYGYRIENGTAFICEEQAGQIRKIYEGYLSGLSLRNAAMEAGVKLPHAVLSFRIGRIMITVRKSV